MILDLATLESVFKEHAEREEELRFRNPSFSFWYNWLVVALIFVLFAGFGWWATDISRRTRDEAVRAQVLAEMDAEHEQMMAEAAAREAELQASKEVAMKKNCNSGAKALYPLGNFVEKYHYSEKDLETYLRSGWNRHILTGESLEEVFSAPQQYLGYADNNPVLTEYYDLAYRCFSEWEEEETRPCDPSFQWAELTENGIYLKNNFNADGYARRWHA